MNNKTDTLFRQKTFQSLILGGNDVKKRLNAMKGSAQKVNDTLLYEILKKNAHTEYGAKYGFASIRSAEQYMSQVPLTDYTDYKPYVLRMSEQGEHNVLTSSRVDYFFSTAGTTGRPKLIPASREQFRLVTAYTNLYRYGLISESLGDIWTDGATFSPLEVRMEKTGSGAMRGAFSSKLIVDLGDMFHIATLSPREAIYSSPGEDTQFLHLFSALKAENVTEMNASYISWLLEMMHRLENEWEVFVRAIRDGVLPSDLNMPPERFQAVSASLQPDPARASFLEKEFLKGFDDPILPRIWKRLSIVIAACGGPFSRHMKQFRRYMGDSIPFYNHGYTASEGVFAVPNALNSTDLLLLPDSCYYEFQLFDEDSGAAAGSEHGEPPVLRMDQLEVGKAYLVIITNQSGFYRYRMHDVIRVKGFHEQLPVIEMMYREDIMSIAGEHFSEYRLSQAAFQSMAEKGFTLSGFSVYIDSDSKSLGRFVFLLEPAQDGPFPDPDMLGKRIMELLKQGNEEAERSFEKGYLACPLVKYLKKGTYEQYRIFIGDRGLGGNQVKPPEILRQPELISFFLAHVRR